MKNLPCIDCKTAVEVPDNYPDTFTICDNCHVARSQNLESALGDDGFGVWYWLLIVAIILFVVLGGLVFLDGH